MGTHFLWNPINDNIVKEFDDAGNTIADYTTEPNLYGDLISQHRSGQSSFYHYDGQGSTTSLTDSAGNVTDTYAYSAFGEVAAQTGSTVNPFQYIGRHGYYKEENLGDYLVRRRSLDSSRGQWLSQDFFPGNDYIYSANSPILLIDPSGLIVSGGFKFKLALIGAYGYRGVGGGFDVALTRTAECCTDTAGIVHKAWSPCSHIVDTLKLRVEVGFGLGFDVRFLGFKGAALLKIADTYIELGGACDYGCGCIRTTECCRVCRDGGIDLPAAGPFETYSIAIGVVGIKGRAVVNGSWRVCYNWGIACPTPGLAIGFCGFWGFIGELSFPMGEFYIQNINSGCFALVGTPPMLEF